MRPPWYVNKSTEKLVFASAGDLLAALLLARIHQQPDQLSTAVELAVAGLQGVLDVTAAAAGPAATAAGMNDK